MNSDRPDYSFNPGAPPEVSSYFRNKSLKPSFSWQDVEPEEHAVSFAVAKAMNADVLEALQGAIQQAIDEGIPYDQFAKELKPRLRKLGWWGVKEQVDPASGEVRKVRLGSPRRLKTIYRANIRSARAAGQWDRIQRTKRALPYLVYLLGPSERHRLHHQARAGTVLPVDHPFWESWYPPNGWGCKCHVRQITKREAEERGVSNDPSIQMRDVFNTRTGELKRIPAGIDPGWEANPGIFRQRQMQQFLNGKLDGAAPSIARAAARDMASSWRLRRIQEGTALGAVPVGMLPADLAASIGARTRVVQFSSQTATKQSSHHPDIDVGEYVRAADLLEDADRIVLSDTHLAFIEKSHDLPWIMVIKRTLDASELYMSTLYRAHSSRYVDRLRKRGR